MFKLPALYATDGYKIGHKAMLAEGTTRLGGTWIPRSVKYMHPSITKVVSIGQALTWRYIHDIFEEFFEGGVEQALEFAKDMSLYLGLEYDAQHFIDLYHLDYLPIKVYSLPEGIETKPNVPHMFFVNTVDGFGWLTLFLETIISATAWKMPTSATNALAFRRAAQKAFEETDSASLPFIGFHCHDFSARGLDPFSMYTSGIGHASCFLGSDTLAVIPASRYYYKVGKDEMPIYSVNASEHSVSTTKIFTVGEKQMIIDWLSKFPKGIFSLVADTFDLWKLLTEYVADAGVKQLTLSRDGKLVIRPDSGDPVDIICGLQIEDEDSSFHGIPYKAFNGNGKIYQFKERDGSMRFKTEEVKGVVEILWDIFGGTINKEGYKVLDPHIGLIYGDSINLERQAAIYERLKKKGFAVSNVVLGIGSFTYQFNSRDSLGFAAKGSWFEVKDEDGVKTTYDIYKDPVTDDGTKKSLKGFVNVVDIDGEPTAVEQCTEAEMEEGMWNIIYLDGQLYENVLPSLNDIRENINKIV